MTAADQPARTSAAPNAPVVSWARSSGLVPYEAAVTAMEARVAGIAAGRASELVWLLQHPPLYTAGTSANPADLIDAAALPVYPAGRGGQYTYHGPGQRVAYVMLDIRRRFAGDVRAFVGTLEEWLIKTLAGYGLIGEVRPGRVGVWISRSGDGGIVEEKIAAIGIRVRHGISFHGISLNVDPNLAHFAGIVPCGLADFGVTSLRALGLPSDIDRADNALRAAFERLIAPTASEDPPWTDPSPTDQRGRALPPQPQ